MTPTRPRNGRAGPPHGHRRRPGAAGKGFAVVADEVRKLAEESQTAAASIAGLIDHIQRDTQTAVQLVEAGAPAPRMARRSSPPRTTDPRASASRSRWPTSRARRRRPPRRSRPRPSRPPRRRRRSPPRRRSSPAARRSWNGWSASSRWRSRHAVAVRLRPATAADAAVATRLIIAGDIDQVGEADYSLEALHDEWSESARARQGRGDRRGRRGHGVGYAHFRGNDLIAVGRPGARGGGRSAPRCSSGPSGAARERGRRGPPGRRRPRRDRPGAPRGRTARSTPQLLADGARRHSRRDADRRPATLAPRRPDAARDHQPPSRATAATSPRARRTGPGASSTATASTTRSAASPSATARWATRSSAAGSTTRSTSRCSRSTPTRRATASAAAADAVFAAAAPPGGAGARSTSPPTTRTRSTLRARGDAQRWRVDDYQKPLPD